MAKLVDGVADRSEQLGSYLTRADGEQILARRRGVRAQAAMAVRRQQRRARVPRVAVHEGVEQRPLPEPLGRGRRRDVGASGVEGSSSGAGHCGACHRRRGAAAGVSSSRLTAAAVWADTQEELHEQPIGELLKQLATRDGDAGPPGARAREGRDGEKGRKAGPGFGMIGAAGGVRCLRCGALTAFFILALDGVMPNWLAALLVAARLRRWSRHVLYMRGQGQGRGCRLARAATNNRDA